MIVVLVRVLLVWLTTFGLGLSLFSPCASAQNDVLANQSFDISLAELVNDDGKILLPEGFSGSIDPTGFSMVSGADGSPKFVRSGGSPNDAWSEGEFGYQGCTGDIGARVSTMVTIDGQLYLGGRFQACGSAKVSNIARFDPSSGEFAALGDGVSGDFDQVDALTAIGTDLYVGGSFSEAGGAAAQGIAKFDTTQSGNAGWSALGDGVSGGIPTRVNALAAIGTDLYVGGSFNQAGGTAANSIAKFDATQTGNAGWSALGDGVSDTDGGLGFVGALTAMGAELYVGGFFSEAGGTAAQGMAKFDSTQSGNAGWSMLGDGVSGGDFARVNAMIAIGTDLYVGGNFTQSGSVPAGRIARFDTTQSGNAGWSTLGNGVNGSDVWDLAAIGTDLYVGGLFTEVGGAMARGVARFDTTQTGNDGWSALGDGVSPEGAFGLNAGSAFAMAAVGTDLYVGGEFILAGDESASSFAKYDTSQIGNAGWSALGGGGVNGTVIALTAIDSELYALGWFSEAGGAAARQIAKFDTTQTGSGRWSALGDGVDGTVDTLTAIGKDLYVGGEFTEAGGAAARRIAKFDTTQTGNAGWSALGDGANDSVYALTSIGTDLYVGGAFSFVGGVAASRVAKFDTTRRGNAGWSALGDGVNNTDGGLSVVYALTAIGTDLYVGGDFSQAGGAAANGIVKFDTTQTNNAGWSVQGDGVNGTVNALATIGTDLYVGGSFSEAGATPASDIAKYDTTQTGNAGWSALGDGITDRIGFIASTPVNALAAIGTDLYVGGWFTHAGDAAADNIAKFDTNETGNAGWSALGDGTNGAVRALSAIGSDLYVGGSFSEAGGKINLYFARNETTSKLEDIFRDSFEVDDP